MTKEGLHALKEFMMFCGVGFTNGGPGANMAAV